MSNAVGQRVMHDLRASVYRHLQRMSLAFFTRTRTGEVQSRIANDIGGLDSVVTTTATTIAQNATTVIASLVAMLLLDWRLALISLVVRAVVVYLTRRVGKIRREDHDRAAAAPGRLSALVAESLSVSGIMLGKTMGRGGDLGRPLHRRVARGSPISRSAPDGRAVGDVDDPDDLRDPAGDRLLAGGSDARSSAAISIGNGVAFTTLQTRLLFPIQSLLGVGADVEASLALFDRIFEYLDLPIDIVEAPDPVTLRPEEVLARCASRTCRSATRRDELGAVDAAATSTSSCPRARGRRSSGETGAGKTTLGYLVARLYEPAARAG